MSRDVTFDESDCGIGKADTNASIDTPDIKDVKIADDMVTAKFTLAEDINFDNDSDVDQQVENEEQPIASFVEDETTKMSANPNLRR